MMSVFVLQRKTLLSRWENEFLFGMPTEGIVANGENLESCVTSLSP